MEKAGRAEAGLVNELPSSTRLADAAVLSRDVRELVSGERRPSGRKPKPPPAVVSCSTETLRVSGRDATLVVWSPD
jgi:hypothetical protein